MERAPHWQIAKSQIGNCLRIGLWADIYLVSLENGRYVCSESSAHRKASLVSPEGSNWLVALVIGERISMFTDVSVAGGVRQVSNIVLPGRMAEEYYCVLYDEKYYLVSCWDVYEQGYFDPSKKRL